MPVGWYTVSKHAVEALSETLRSEVMKFGIRVVVNAPGLIKTDLLKKSLYYLKQ